MADLSSIDQRVRRCTECALHATRTNAVPGEGSPQADLMFIGEGPGFHEDRQGRPFVGPAGQFLNELLGSVGLRREDVYITNMVKCRPPHNRDPFPGEIASCSAYLEEQIATIRPKVIIPLGQHALAKWFPNGSIGKLRAKPKRFGDVTVLPMYHPAAALHNGNLRGTIVADFAQVGELLKESPPPAAPPPQPVTGQPSMLDGTITPVPAVPQADEPPVEAPEPQHLVGQPSLF